MRKSSSTAYDRATRGFGPLLRGEASGLALVLLRNLLLVIIAIDVARMVARAPLTTELATRGET